VDEMKVRVFARAEDGTETDVTEGVQALYDLVIGSMDWGSGFLSVEDARPVVHVAKTCGFTDWEQAQKYVDDQIHSLEQQRFRTERRGARPISHGPDQHIFSSVGRCMWPRCKATESEPR
jgi:hypothetical protein